MPERAHEPHGWSVERPTDFGDYLEREPPTYEDEDSLGDGTESADTSAPSDPE